MPLPLLAGALARAELAACCWGLELCQLCGATLQQLLPAPGSTALQLSELLLMSPLQLHHALQLPQLFQAGGLWLCRGIAEVPCRTESILPVPSPADPRKFQALPAP